VEFEVVFDNKTEGRVILYQEDFSLVNVRHKELTLG
jgi:hypothetical protein